MELRHSQVLVRLLVATLIGGALGLEREYRGHQAGLKTHVLVCLGSCLYALEGTYGLPFGAATAFSSVARADISRVTSQIVVGIGFLGGGAIMRLGTSVKGLTTAAGVWVSAAIGIACALGRFFDAGIVGALVLFTFICLRAVEKRFSAGTQQRDPEGS